MLLAQKIYILQIFCARTFLKVQDDAFVGAIFEMIYFPSDVFPERTSEFIAEMQ